MTVRSLQPELPALALTAQAIYLSRESPAHSAASCQTDDQTNVGDTSDGVPHDPGLINTRNIGALRPIHRRPTGTERSAPRRDS